MKNILYIGGFELPDKNAAAQRVIANAKLFAKLGYKVSFLGVSESGISSKTNKKTQEIDGFTFDVWEQKYPTSNRKWLSFLTDISFVKSIVKEEFNNNLDVIVVYNYPSVALLRLIGFCKRHNIKLIADVTEWYEPRGNFVFRIIKGFDSYFRMRVLHKKLDGIIAISAYLYNYYKSMNRIQLPPLVDKNSEKWNLITSEDRNYKKIVYVGSPGNGAKDRLDKIIASLARIIRRLDPIKFVVIGITKTEYISSFGEDSLPKILDSVVCFEGRKKHLEAVSEIKSADYSIFLRDKNLVNTAGFPTKFVESITCSTPVLTNSSSNVVDFLMNGELGYLLDYSTNEKLDSSLKNALDQDNNRVHYMKQTCNTFEKFHYEYYEKQFVQFLKVL